MSAGAQVAKQVLIADDSGVVRVMRAFLESTPDVEVCGEASDRVEAMEKAKALKPDLVVPDLAMPGIDGAKVASVLKKTMPEVPIILFTMYDENVGKYLTSAIGVDAILSKRDHAGQSRRFGADS